MNSLNRKLEGIDATVEIINVKPSDDGRSVAITITGGCEGLLVVPFYDKPDFQEFLKVGRRYELVLSHQEVEQ